MKKRKLTLSISCIFLDIHHISFAYLKSFTWCNGRATGTWLSGDIYQPCQGFDDKVTFRLISMCEYAYIEKKQHRRRQDASNWKTGE